MPIQILPAPKDDLREEVMKRRNVLVSIFSIAAPSDTESSKDLSKKGLAVHTFRLMFIHKNESEHFSTPSAAVGTVRAAVETPVLSQIAATNFRSSDDQKE